MRRRRPPTRRWPRRPASSRRAGSPSDSVGRRDRARSVCPDSRRRPRTARQALGRWRYVVRATRFLSKQLGARRRTAHLRLRPRRRSLGRLLHHVIVAAAACPLRVEGAERAHVAHQLPDLLVAELVLPCRHPVRPPIRDRREDLLRLTAVDPFFVHQWRTDAAAALKVAAGAVHLVVQRFAFRDSPRVVVVRCFDLRDDVHRSRLQLTDDEGRCRRCCRGRILGEAPILPLTCAEREKQERAERRAWRSALRGLFSALKERTHTTSPLSSTSAANPSWR